jgi:hypothetical protein
MNNPTGIILRRGSQLEKGINDAPPHAQAIRGRLARHKSHDRIRLFEARSLIKIDNLQGTQKTEETKPCETRILSSVIAVQKNK